MKTYSVKQISEMLETNPETVRRWIRDHELKAVQLSKKTGNVITEEELQKFVKSKPKYQPKFLAGSLGIAGLTGLTGSIGMGAVVGGIIASALLGYCGEKKKTDVTIKADDLKEYLNKTIKKLESQNAKKQALLRKTEMEIETLNRKIDQYRYLLRHEDLLRGTLETVISEKEDALDE